MGLSVERVPTMSYGRFLSALDDVAVGLSLICPENPFSRGKSFGKVLAYLDRDVPVVASDEADHRLLFRPGTGVISNDPAVWAVLSSEAAARAIDRVLQDVLDANRTGGR